MINKILEEVGKSFGRQVFEAFIAHGAVALAENAVVQGLDYLKNKKLIELTKEGGINNPENVHPGENVQAHPRVVMFGMPPQQQADQEEEEPCCDCCRCSCHYEEYEEYDEELDEESVEEEKPKSKSSKKKPEPEPEQPKSKSKSKSKSKKN